MGRASHRASAPGSLMLLGEHAVLHGRRALVCAVNQRISARLTPRDDDAVAIVSSFGEHRTDIRRLASSPSLRFVMAALAHWKGRLPSGFGLTIESEFPSDVGFGSSAAVTVATLAAAGAWMGERLDPPALVDLAVRVVHQVQGLGSGADVAASVYGGTLLYRAEPREARRLDHSPRIVAVYSGHKEPTVEVVRRVEAARKERPDLFEALFDLMDRSAERAAEAIGRRDWQEIGRLLDFNQGLMEALGVSTPVLADIVFKLRAHRGILGAKISGSGLGDCVVAAGRAELTDFPYVVIPVEVATEGVRVEHD
ncbi:MAG: mevalonate kinase [Kiritimatiellae bacterium]|nr:mevalonate kinase [Kiritimatiellia bacterium]